MSVAENRVFSVWYSVCFVDMVSTADHVCVLWSPSKACNQPTRQAMPYLEHNNPGDILSDSSNIFLSNRARLPLGFVTLFMGRFGFCLLSKSTIICVACKWGIFSNSWLDFAMCGLQGESERCVPVVKK